jgi:hypothetical protein
MYSYSLAALRNGSTTSSRDYCSDRCGQSEFSTLPSGVRCHCDSFCTAGNDCCPDYRDVCTGLNAPPGAGAGVRADGPLGGGDEGGGGGGGSGGATTSVSASVGAVVATIASVCVVIAAAVYAVVIRRREKIARIARENRVYRIGPMPLGDIESKAGNDDDDDEQELETFRPFGRSHIRVVAFQDTVETESTHI